MEAEHFNGLDKGDFDIEDGEAGAEDATADADTARETAEEEEEMHGTRRRRMLKAGDREKTLHYGYNGAAGLEKVNNARG